MAALLHDRGAFAVVFAHDDEGAAGDAARCKIGERVGRDIDAHRSLECRCAPQRVIDGGGKRRGRRGLAGARFEPDPQLLQEIVRIGEHIDQMRDRRPLIAGDIGNAGLQERLGDGKNSFAAESWPSPSRSFLTSCLNDRSAICVLLLRPARSAVQSDL